MDIIPPVVLFLVQFYYEALVMWLGQRLYERLLPRWRREFLVTIHDLVDLRPLEAACGSYYHSQGGGTQPVYTVAMLVRALLVRYVYHWSYAETERQMNTNLVVRWFVGLPVSGATPDHTTLFRFESWVRQEHKRAYFDTLLAQFQAAFPAERCQPQIGDTFAMQAEAAQETLTRKLRHTCRILVREIKKNHPAGYARFTPLLDEHTPARLLLHPPKGRRPEKYLDKAAYQQRVQEVVLGVLDFQQLIYCLLPGCPGESLARIGLRLADLERVLRDEVKIERSPTGEIVRIQELPSDKKGSPLLGSATDREATYRVHDGGEDVQLGYNVGLLATPRGAIHEIAAFTGSTADQEVFPTLVANEMEHGDCPHEVIFDRAGGSGKTRYRIAQLTGGKTTVIAYTMPYDERTDRFVPTDFSLSPDAQTLTCPFGKTTAIVFNHGHGDGRMFRFRDELCQACPFNPHTHPACLDPQADLEAPLPPSGHRICRDPKAKADSFRMVYISSYRQILEQAEAFNQTQIFKDRIKLRPRIERLIAELTRYQGARRARCRGTDKADFQAKMCATAHNLKLWVRQVWAADASARKARPQLEAG